MVRRGEVRVDAAARVAASRAAAKLNGQNATKKFKETRAGASIILCGRALGFPPYESVCVGPS